MYYPLLFACYQRDEDALRLPANVRTFFDELAALGYHLVTQDETANTFGAWWYTIRHTPERLKPEEEPFVDEVFQAGLSLAFSEALDAYLMGESRNLKLRAYNVKHVIEFTLELCPDVAKEIYTDNPDGPTLLVEVDRDYLTGGYEGDGLAAFERLIEIVKLLYRHFHPFYAAIAYDQDFYEIQEDTSWLDAFNGQIHSLTLINIFGPELVERYGRAHLLKTPLWGIDELDDGGLLLLPEPYWYGYTTTWRAARLHLGMSVEHYRYIAHLAALLHENDLLPQVTGELLRDATSKPCALQALATLLPERYITYSRERTDEEALRKVMQRYAAATGGEWEPENLCVSFKGDMALIRFDIQRMRYVRKLRSYQPSFEKNRDYWDIYNLLEEFAEEYLSSRYVKIETLNASGEDHVFFLPASVAAGIHNLLPRLKSGWPTLDELRQLFPDVDPVEWEQVCPESPWPIEFTSKREASPCCDGYRIELCRLVRHGLSFCRGWH